MKISGFSLALLLTSLACASAQVTVEVAQEQQQFLPGEALKIAVRITNLSGRELRFGEEDNWLTFEVASREGMVVPQIGEVPVVGAFTLESSKVGIKRLDLAPYFILAKPGNYQVVATVRIRGWNREIASNPKSFDLVQGVKLWEQEVGIPGSGAAPDTQPEMRRYILQQANFSRGQIRLFVRVTDAYSKPIRVLALGSIVSFGRPETQVDRLSNLHVLCQDGPSSYNYTVCDTQGEVVLHQSYDHSDTRPRLRQDDEGAISVKGGTRRFADNDVPRSKEEDSAEAAPSEPPKTHSGPAQNQAVGKASS